MKRKLGKSLAFSIIAALFISMMSAISIIPVFALPPGPHIYMDGPYNFDTSTVSTGYKFNVTIYIENLTYPYLAMSWQLNLYYDQSMINVTEFYGKVTKAPSYRVWPNDNLGGRAWNNNYLFRNDSGTIGNPFWYNLGANSASVKWADVLAGDTNVTEKRMMGRVEFKVIDVPDKLDVFNCTLGINNVDFKLYDSIGNMKTRYAITVDDSWYALTWKAPPKPYLAIDPTTKTFGPFPPSAVGQQFDIKVYIKELDAAWGLTNASIWVDYKTALIDTEVANVTIAPAWDWSDVQVVHGTPDLVKIIVKETGLTPPSGTSVLVATIKFKVMYQGAYPTTNTSDVSINGTLFDHIQEILQRTAVPGKVTVIGLLTIPLPWLEVDPKNVTLGPEPSIGKQFTVDIKVANLHFAWYMVGVQYHLTFDKTLLDVVSVTEGPFLQDPSWNLHGTYPISFVEEDPIIGWNVLFGDMLLPNGTGKYDQTSWPNGTGVVTKITFKAIKQVYPYTYFCPLEFVKLSPYLIDRNGKEVPVNETMMQDGFYRIKTTPLPGRIIDLYTQYPRPYGGQGPHQPSDMFWPQKQVELYANVTYNFWPVQQKIVSYEVEGPFWENGSKKPAYQIWAKLTDITNSTGVARVTFRLPWPCDNPESLFGVWKVTATVDVACIVINDTLKFHFDYLVRIWSVKTDKYTYKHGETVVITINYGSHAQQAYPVLFSAVLVDELDVPVGFVTVSLTVKGAVWCQYKNSAVTVRITIPKFAFAGYASIHVNAFNKDPTIGGSAWCPEYVKEIFIQPF